MPLKIIRNDITKMHCDAIVNTANEYPVVGRGCDTAVYEAAGYQELLAYREKEIGRKQEGEAFITPGYHLHAKYIIHAVSPAYRGGTEEEEEKLRSCYRNSFALALSNDIRSIAFPLIATGSYHYPKEEGMRVAVDEINAFLLQHDMLVYLVVFDELAVHLGRKIYPGLESYLDRNYFELRHFPAAASSGAPPVESEVSKKRKNTAHIRIPFSVRKKTAEETPAIQQSAAPDFDKVELSGSFCPHHESRLDERLEHLSDTFSEYLLFLIESKGMTNAEVYKRAIVDKKTFSKIKSNRDAHPQKMTAMCLCIGAMLNMDESRDLLARAGYALSPSSKTDMIFAYFIENKIYDMIELDIQLEEHGLPCLIS